MGVHASSNFVAGLNYDLGGACTTFTTSIGIDDEVGDRGSVVFQVYGDGKKLYDSGVMRGSDAARSISVGVKDVKALKLALTDAGDTMNFDHANWADAIVVCASSTPPSQPAGTLDPSFGTQGTANIGGLSAVTELDGSIVYVSQETNAKTFTLTRLRADGTTVKAPAVSGELQLADSSEIGLRYSKHQILLRQQDGKLVLVGRRDASMVILRFNADLSLDGSFGNAGRAVVSVANQPFGSVNAVVQQADGKLVVAGSAGNGEDITDVALVRLTASGQLDSGFGTGGLSVVAVPPNENTSPPSRRNSAESVVVQPDGKLVVFVSGQVEATEIPRIIRLNTNGSLDTGFGKDGVVFTGANSPRMNQIALEADGSILNVGADGRVLTVPVIYRVSPDGKTVKRFDYPDQFAKLQNPGDTVEFTDLKVQPGGKIYTSGYIRVYVSQDGGQTYNEDASNFLARLNADLTLDKTFGTNGILRTPLVFGDRLLEQPNKILIYNTTQTVRYWR